jgi:hypothetical protein
MRQRQLYVQTSRRVTYQITDDLRLNGTYRARRRVGPGAASILATLARRIRFSPFASFSCYECSSIAVAATSNSTNRFFHREHPRRIDTREHFTEKYSPEITVQILSARAREAFAGLFLGFAETPLDLIVSWRNRPRPRGE